MASYFGPRLGHWSAALLPLTAACSLLGGQSSDDSGGEGCPIDERVLDDDATASSLGYSAGTVLSWALATRAATAAWRPAWDGISTNAPAGDTEITVTVSRGDGPATEAYCESRRLYVPTRVALSTADGVVVLEVDATLHSGREDFAFVEAEFDFDDMTGTFAWQSEEPGVELVQPRLALTLSPLGFSGELSAIRQVETSDAISDTAVPPGGLLSWPSGSACRTDQVSFVLSEADRVWTDGPALVNASTWTQVGGEVDMQPAAVSLAAEESLCESDDEGLRRPATLRVRTEDGVVDHSVRGHLVPADGGIRFTNEYERYWWTPSELAERYGDFGQDLSGYESTAVIVRLSVSSETAEGSFRIEGSVDDCQAECTADGCGGCGPTRDVVIFERRFVASGP